MDNNKKIWTVKSHLTIGFMFLLITLVLYWITKPEITPSYIKLWYSLLGASTVLSVLLIIRGLTDKKPDK